MTASFDTAAPTHSTTHFSISAVERDTGLSKDVLRVWERRYGFPVPDRDENDERQYPLSQVERLRAIKRLMDGGLRPGKLLGLSAHDLAALCAQQARPRRAGEEEAETVQQQALTALHDGNLVRLRALLSQSLLKHGLQAFVTETVAPLNRAITEASTRGTLATFQERAYVEQITQVLRGALLCVAAPHDAPRMLLATLPNETNALSLLMVEAMLLPEGVACVSLGTQVPIPEVAAAVSAFDADIVVLPFSASFSSKQAVASLETLRGLLPDNVPLWAGGELIRRIRRDIPGVTPTGALADKLAALRQWRSERANHAQIDRP
jgi:MerR family transcriptional regulator, light-induced transcriptional regulator